MKRSGWAGSSLRSTTRAGRAVPVSPGTCPACHSGSCSPASSRPRCSPARNGTSAADAGTVSSRPDSNNSTREKRMVERAPTGRQQSGRGHRKALVMRCGLHDDTGLPYTPPADAVDGQCNNARGRPFLSNEHGIHGQTPAPDDAAAIAHAFTTARRGGQALPGFPGLVPPDLVAAYQVQDLAIASWDDQVVGWKVGYIAAERRDASGDDRLLGPVFSRQLKNATGGTVDIPVFVGGFGAVEAEYVLELLEDAPAAQLHWTPEQAEALPARLYIGVEVASSPLATINELGPRVVVSDFG